MSRQVLKSKFLGALLGTGVGDALGAPFEGRRKVELEEIQRLAERREVLTYTDDTHMMIGVAQSLIAAEGFDGDDMAHTFINNYELEPFRGYGPGPSRIFRVIRAGEAWDKAAQKLYHGGSYGNGSAMRDEVYKRKLNRIKDLLGEPDKAKVAAELGNGIEAFNSVPTAIYSFLAQPDSFAQAVFYAISLGGDTDTIGAMTGAISGAHLGIEAIPSSWRNKLENKQYIEELAEKLWSLKG